MPSAINELNPTNSLVSAESSSSRWRFAFRVMWIAIQIVAIYFMCLESEPFFYQGF